MRAALNATFVTLLLTVAPLCSTARAATVADASGHWEGMVVSPYGSQSVGVDIAHRPDQSLKGALSGDNISGVALSSVSQTGDVVRFALGSSTSFEGRLQSDGKVIAGSLSTPQGDVGLTLTRDGEAEFQPAPVNARVDPHKEGVWEGALDVAGRHLRVRLTLANRPDGHADGVFASLDEGLDLPATITEDGAKLTLIVPGVAGIWEGELNSSGEALVGTYAQREVVAPLTLQRVKN